ncbi:pigment epithelium-derived factor-like [Heptranchias perlo]|uniref:pigment epithelium-derived factor-like n=1 Tax=Heptranchias perlo TaxID=212740 RepID=UPI00355942DF
MKILFALVFLGGVGLSSTQNGHSTLSPFEDESTVLGLTDLPPDEEEEEFLTSPVQRLAYSVSEFGYDLYRLEANRNPSANVFMSPLSVATALSALSLGAVSTNEQILKRVLNYDLVKDLDVHSVYKDLLTEITTVPKQFKMVSRIYAKKLRMKGNFLNEVEKFYFARPKAMLGNKQQELRNINQWVRSRTSGLIGRAIHTIPQDLSLLLLSAAHYKGQLLTKFNSAETTRKAFSLDHDRAVNVPMMSGTHYPLRYGFDSDLNCKIGLFRYLGDISLLIFLPTDIRKNMTMIEENLNPVFIHDLVRELQDVQASVSLPRLKLDTDQELKELLGEMNLRPMYTPSRMNKITNVPVMVSSIKHRAFLELVEQGVTKAPVSDPSDRQLTMDFHVNRPFILVLYDNASGSLLQIARVLDPRGLVKDQSQQ